LSTADVCHRRVGGLLDLGDGRPTRGLVEVLVEPVEQCRQSDQLQPTVAEAPVRGIHPLQPGDRRIQVLLPPLDHPQQAAAHRSGPPLLTHAGELRLLRRGSELLDGQALEGVVTQEDSRPDVQHLGLERILFGGTRDHSRQKRQGKWGNSFVHRLSPALSPEYPPGPPQAIPHAQGSPAAGQPVAPGQIEPWVTYCYLDGQAGTRARCHLHDMAPARMGAENPEGGDE